MKKRAFLEVAALAAVTLPSAAKPAGATGPGLLTVTAATLQANRGAFDPALDQMFKKHKLSFQQARSFDFAALLALPAITIRPTLEYDAKVHELRGPLLHEVLVKAGVGLKPGSRIVLRAVDGYAATITLEQARAQRYIVATHLDGKPLALGGLGPLWALCDADRVPALAAAPLADRFGACPWALYHIDAPDQA
ncbi:MAG: molybdopterin-dependent oxidoreductase [Pseudomonadota bacterium]